MATKTPLPKTVRPLYEIAREIARDPAYQRAAWCAEPYRSAAASLTTVTDTYGADDGDGVVRYLISNLGQYRGETARRVKAELKAHLAGVKPQV